MTDSTEKLIQPLPWRAEAHGEFWCVRDPNDFVVFSDVLQDEAEFIVAAVNHHAELVEALRAFVDAYGKSLQLEKTDVAFRLAQAVLAKVTSHV